MQRPPYSRFIEHFSLDRSLVFLNHGPFGAVPIPVQQRQEEWRRRIEREPVRFMVEDLEPALDSARAAVARFVGCPAADMAFVHNATAAVNTVVRSIRWRPGDELLISNQEYNACNNAVRFAADFWGATAVCAELPWPVRDEQQVYDAVMARVTPRTRLALISHITSPTAIILPIARLVRDLQARGVDVLLDGAHAPGFVDLNIASLNPLPAYYTGNLHKWACAPKGSAFLYVRPDRQEAVRPLIISHGANSPRRDRPRFRLEFDFIGSLDYSPWLASPDSIDFMGGLLPGGWGALREHNRRTALGARAALCAALQTAAPAPESMLGCMASVMLPAHDPARAARLADRATKYADALQDNLIARWGIQVPVIRHANPAAPGGFDRSVRLSAQVYNTPEQYDYLARALVDELAAERGA